MVKYLYIELRKYNTSEKLSKFVLYLAKRNALKILLKTQWHGTIYTCFLAAVVIKNPVHTLQNTAVCPLPGICGAIFLCRTRTKKQEKKR